MYSGIYTAGPLRKAEVTPLIDCFIHSFIHRELKSTYYATRTHLGSSFLCTDKCVQDEGNL